MAILTVLLCGIILGVFLHGWRLYIYNKAFNDGVDACATWIIDEVETVSAKQYALAAFKQLKKK